MIKVKVIWNNDLEQELECDIREVSDVSSWEEYLIQEMDYYEKVDAIKDTVSGEIVRERFKNEFKQDPDFDPYWGLTDEELKDLNDEIDRKCKETDEYKEILDTTVTSESNHYPKTLREVIEDGEWMEIGQEGMTRTILIEE